MTREERALIRAALAWDKAKKESDDLVRLLFRRTNPNGLLNDKRIEKVEVAKFRAQERLFAACKLLADAKAKETP